GRAQPTGTRDDHPRQRSRRAGDPGAQAQARLDDDRRGYRVRALVCPLHLPADRARRSRRAARHSATLTARRARTKKSSRADNPAPKTQPHSTLRLRLEFYITDRDGCGFTPACSSHDLDREANNAGIGLRLDPALRTLSDLAWLVTKLKCGRAMFRLLRRVMTASAATAPTRRNNWPEGFDSPCIFGCDPVSLGGPKGNDSRP